MSALDALTAEIVECRRCPRLVEWREQVAREKRAAFRDEEYWGRPAPGFGDPAARILILGLAPAAHGANRTGRIFTGDRSGDFLFASMHRLGLANQALSVSRDDGLRLEDAYVIAAVRCAPPANKPTPQERDTCEPWLEREVALLERLRVVVCLGGFAWDSALRLRGAIPRPRPKFGHGAELAGERFTLLGCFHPSQQNTFTGRLTPAMMDTVFARARELAGERRRLAQRARVAGSNRPGGDSPGPGDAMSRYGEILRAPQVGPLVASSLLSRLPVGINSLALVLFLSAKTGSFAIAGAVSGSLAAGSGLGAAFAGRLVDRLGARRVLVPLACIHAASLGAILASAYAGLPAAVMVCFGLLAGAATPPTSAVLRSMWADLLPPRLHQAAYALDSTLIELIFITGPLLTAVLTALFSPAAALVVSPLAAIGGTAVFTALPAARGLVPHPEAHAAGRLGALAAPGVRTLIYISVPVGIGIGILEVGIPGFCRIEGAPAAAGVLLAVWSFGSGIGGLAYGLLPRRAGLERTHLIVAALLPLMFLPLAAAPSVAVMGLLVIPAGCMIAPLLATRNELVARVAPENARTEAYTWPVTAFVVGIAIGSALAGVLLEGPGWRTAFVVASAVGFSGFVLALARRSTLGRTSVRVRTL